jgi:hypothetical protein
VGDELFVLLPFCAFAIGSVSENFPLQKILRLGKKLRPMNLATQTAGGVIESGIKLRSGITEVPWPDGSGANSWRQRTRAPTTSQSSRMDRLQEESETARFPQRGPKCSRWHSNCFGYKIREVASGGGDVGIRVSGVLPGLPAHRH